MPSIGKSGEGEILWIRKDALASAGLGKETVALLMRISRDGKEERRQRQARGIAAARARGVRLGRPEAEMPEDFGRIVTEWESKRISLEGALRLCGISRATFFRRLKRYREGRKEGS